MAAILEQNPPQTAREGLFPRAELGLSSLKGPKTDLIVALCQLRRVKTGLNVEATFTLVEQIFRRVSVVDYGYECWLRIPESTRYPQEIGDIGTDPAYFNKAYREPERQLYEDPVIQLAELATGMLAEEPDSGEFEELHMKLQEETKRTLRKYAKDTRSHSKKLKLLNRSLGPAMPYLNQSVKDRLGRMLSETHDTPTLDEECGDTRAPGANVIVMKVDKYVEEEKVINQTVNIDYGDGNTFNGDVKAGEFIKDSFNNAEKASGDKQGRIKELAQVIAELTEKLELDQQAKVAAKLNLLTAEAASDAPDKDILQVTGKGLIEAAKTLAEMVGPVTKAVMGVLGIFGVAL